MHAIKTALNEAVPSGARVGGPDAVIPDPSPWTSASSTAATAVERLDVASPPRRQQVHLQRRYVLNATLLQATPGSRW